MPTLQKTVYLKAPKDKVWQFLTEVEKVKIWFHVYDADLTPDQPFTISGAESGKQLGEGRVLRMSPHDLLEYTFSVGPMNGAESTVLWTLDAVDGGTRLNLTHSGLPDGEAAFGLILALDQGWDDHIARMRAPVAEDTPVLA
jgi:uncharacterized protein YndB with AHSA1/START domain